MRWPRRGFRVARADACATARSSTTSSSRRRDLPIGWTDEQDAGTLPARAPRRRGALRLRGRPALVEAVPAPAAGPALAGATRGATASRSRRSRSRTRPLAFIGVRACELHAIAIQDRVFLGGRYADRDYAARREDAFVVAVNCFEPAGTCFCVSMGTGPKAEAGYDLALTEILDGEHRLLVEVGSERGAEVLRDAAAPRGAAAADLDAAGAAVAGAAERDGAAARHRPTSATCSRATSSTRAGTRSPTRCLTCGNCTLVCPTCFCTTVEDVDRPDRRATPSATRAGTPASRSTTPTSTAAASGRRPSRATASG